MLRIDDMDRERMRPEYVADIFDTLQFMQLQYKGGPGNVTDFEENWSQLQRMDLYNAALEQLRDSGLVFACDCSRTKVLQDHPLGHYQGTCMHKSIPLDTPGVSWRIDTTSLEQVHVNTLENGGVDMLLPESVHYFVVRKKDGFPAYQLTSLIDDLHFGVDLVVRGIDLWDSTCAQLGLAKALNQPGFQQTVFHHHPLLTDTGNMKLSKSAGATSIKYQREQGATRADILQLITQKGDTILFS